MKKRIAAIVLVLVLLIGSALAEYYVVADGGKCNVRKGPSLDHKDFATLKKGQTVPFTGDIDVDERGVEWYKIKINGKKGWVSSKYCSIVDDYEDDEDDDEEDAGDEYVKGTSGDSNVRSGPGLSYSTKGALKKGSTAEFAGLISTDDRGVDWYQIYIKGGKGWVSSKYTKLYADDYDYWQPDDDDDEAYDDDDFEDDSDYEDDDDDYTWDDDDDYAHEPDVLFDHEGGETYAMSLNAMDAGMMYAYGKSGRAIQMKADLTATDAISWDNLPKGNLGGIMADPDHDGKDELLVVGQSDDRMLTLSVFETEGTGCRLSDRASTCVSTLPCIDYAYLPGMRIDVFVLPNGDIGIASFNLEGMRGDGVEMQALTVSYNNGKLTDKMYGMYAGSDWDDDMNDTEYMHVLASWGVKANFDDLFGGRVFPADLIADRKQAAGLKSVNLVEKYGANSVGSELCEVRVNEKVLADGELFFSFQ